MPLSIQKMGTCVIVKKLQCVLFYIRMYLFYVGKMTSEDEEQSFIFFTLFEIKLNDLYIIRYFFKPFFTNLQILSGNSSSTFFGSATHTTYISTNLWATLIDPCNVYNIQFEKLSLGDYMENYYKGKNVEEELERNKIPIKDLPENFLWIQVKGGSKMNNLLSHASGILEDKAASAVVWSGSGVAIPKAISCAEILKRQFSIEHQVSKLAYKKVDEFWEPKIDGLETIVVKRQIPVIHILLSIEMIPDANQIGYQTLQGKKFWQKEQTNNNSSKQQQSSYKSRKQFKQKKT